MAFSGKARRARLARLPPARCPLIQGYLPRSLRIRSRCFERRHEQADKRIGAHHKASHRLTLWAPYPMHRHAAIEIRPTQAGQIAAKVPLAGTGVLRFFASGLIFSADAMMRPPLPACAHTMPKPRAIQSCALQTTFFSKMWGCQRSERTREYCYFGT